MFVPPVVLLPLAGFSEDLLLSLVFRSLPCRASECIYSFVSFVFISLGVLWDSWVCDLVTVTHLGQPSIAVTLNIPPALSTLSTWDSDYVNTSFHRGWIWCSCPSSGTYSLGFCLFASIWVMSTGLSLHPLIPPFPFLGSFLWWSCYRVSSSVIYFSFLVSFLVSFSFSLLKLPIWSCALPILSL